MKNWKSVLLGLLVAAIAVGFPVNSNLSYKAGRAAGYSAGYDAGNTAGYVSGKNEGYESGYSDGYDEGEKVGWPKGYSAGYKVGKSYSSSSKPASYSNSGKSSNPTLPFSDQNITVYITNTGSKYHRGWCQYLSKSKTAISLSSAKARGYTACSRCF